VIRDERGVAYVETLIAFPVLFIVFASLFTFAHLAAAHLIVQRAASAAARAVVVFVPDDPFYYAACKGGGAACRDFLEGGRPSREACAKQAAKKVLTTARFFKLEPADLKVEWNDAKEWEQVTVKVKASFDCNMFLGSFLCGIDGLTVISSSSTLNNQQGLVRTQAGK
jgi:hypothetical protein